MFRRKRSSSHARLNTNPSPSAQTAAAQAFKASQSAHNLSSAAAAAALRKHSPTPTSIEDVQTKRMVQRQSSTSSIGSGRGSIRRGRDGSLQRSNSLGSMTARTFREQRPDKSGFVRAPEEITPVPPLPQKYTIEHRRAASSEPSYRAIGPPGTANAGHGRNQDLAARLTRGTSPEYGHKSKRVEPERTASRGSINFSYPMNARPNSPLQPSIHSFGADLPLEQDQTAGRLSREGISNHNLSYSTANNAGEKSPEHEPEGSRSPITSSRNSSETYLNDGVGSKGIAPRSQDTLHPHDVQGTVGGGDPLDEAASKPENGEPDGPGKAATFTPCKEPATQSQRHAVHFTDDLREPFSSETHIPKRRRCPVREDQEVDEELNDPRRSRQSPIFRKDAHIEDNVGPEPHHSTFHPFTESGTAEKPPTMLERSRDSNTVEITKDSKHDRQHSLSPSRTTRFSSHLSILHEGDHLHEPPPRSLSPAKSALKHSPSVSPSADRRSHQAKHGEPPSAMPEGGSIASDDLLKHGKKRTPKVSFDEEAEVVGFAASPPSSSGSSVSTSPQGNAIPRHSWHRKDGDEYDEIMKPRPVLPSFGSIRGKKGLAEEHHGRKHVPEPSVEKLPPDPWATHNRVSSDHAIGGILVNSRRKEPDTRDPSLPLPPEVTSVEGTGYGSVSEPSSSSDGMADPEEFEPRFGQHDDSGIDSKAERKPEGPANGGPAEGVPVISVQPATPAIDEEPKPSGWGSLPGKFPSQVSLPDNQEKSVERHESGTEQPPVEHAKEVPSDVHRGDSESESGESIYSDAAEDWSDMEGDGFGSINAIVESPISSLAPRRKTEPLKEDQAPTDSKTRGVAPTTSSNLATAFSAPSTGYKAETPVQGTQRNADTVQKDLEPQVRWPITEDITTGSKPSVSEHTVPKTTQMPTTESRQMTLQDVEKRASKPNGSIRHTATKNNQVEAAPRVTSNAPRQTRQMVAAVPSAAIKGYPAQTGAVRLERTASNGSYSSSSFRRERPRPRNTGVHTMRRTMRSDDDAGRPLSPNGRPSGAAGGSTTPVSLRRPFSSEGNSTMRTTLRGSVGDSHGKSSSFSAFRKPKKASNISGRYPLIGSRFQSRFEDSSDEDNKLSKPFRSRFDDSSDDEVDNMKLRPVRGIPRRASEVDGDSTELEDSSDGEVKQNAVRKSNGNRFPSPQTSAARKAAANTAYNGGNVKQLPHPETYNSTGQAQPELEDFLPLYPKKPKKRLFGRLGSTKRKQGGDRMIRKSEIDSAARRDTPLERSWGELQLSKHAKLHPDGSDAFQQQGNFTTAISGPNNGANTHHSPPSSRLQKKSGMTRISDRLGSGSWHRRSHAAPSEQPVLATTVPELDEKPPQQPSTEPARPSTSHGPGENGKPKGQRPQDTMSQGSLDESHAWLSRFKPRMLSRRGTGSTADEESVVSAQFDGNTAVGTAALGRGKTKKFPMLRKAFGVSTHSRKDAQRTGNLDFDARVPIPFSVFPSSYRSDAVSETTHSRVEGEVKLAGASRVGREDTGYEGPLPQPSRSNYGREEVDVDVRFQSDRPDRRPVYEEHPRNRYPEVDLSRDRYYEREARRPYETQIDITEREYRRRTDPNYEVQYQSRYRQPREIDVSFDSQYTSVDNRTQPLNTRDIAYEGPSRARSEVSVETDRRTVLEDSPRNKMGYYDDEGHYHSFRRGVERAADRLVHPFSHHGHDHHKDSVVVDERGPSRVHDGVRETVRIVRPRGGHPPDTITIPCHFIRIGDLLILQGRPCQVIRISVSSQTGQHRYLGVDLFTRQLHEESSFVSNPSDSVVVQSMLGPVYKTYRILDLREDGRIVAMTEAGDVKQGLPVLEQGGLFNRISDAFADGRGSVRALVINDGGRELVVDYKVIHGSRL